MQLRPLADDLWHAERPLNLGGGLRLQTRTTVVRLPSGELVVISPLPRLEELQDALRGLGPVAALVAPNLMHHLGLVGMARAFPAARVFGRPGLAKKRAELSIEPLAERPPELWRGVLEHRVVEGMPKLDELAFFHAPSRTLILTDMAFNVRSAEHAVTRWVMRLNGALGSFGPSRIARFLTKDRAALERSVDAMLEWGPERIIVGHGDVVEEDGRAILAQAFGRS